MMPRDASELGNISGGVILSQIDLAASIVSKSVCANARIDRMVTRAMNEVEFRQAVYVGDILCCYGTVQRIGRTSVTVLVEVESERMGKSIPVTSATAVFVALGADGKPEPLCQRKQQAESAGTQTSPEGVPAQAPRQNRIPCQAQERIVALKKVMMPHETNGMGNIFGGLLMTYMDWAGSYVARRACKNHLISRCVTRFMDKIEFKEPVHVNDTITCWGSVTGVGNTSVSVHVEVEADRNGKIVPVTEADLVFVAVNKRGRKVQVGCRSGQRSKAKSSKRPDLPGTKSGSCSCSH